MTNTGATNTGTGKVHGEYGTGIEGVQARAPSQVPVKYAKTTVPRWYRSAKAIERWQKAKRYRDFTPKGANQPIPPSAC